MEAQFIQGIDVQKPLDTLNVDILKRMDDRFKLFPTDLQRSFLVSRRYNRIHKSIEAVSEKHK